MMSHDIAAPALVNPISYFLARVYCDNHSHLTKCMCATDIGYMCPSTNCLYLGDELTFDDPVQSYRINDGSLYSYAVTHLR